jgi:putative transposase
MRTIEVKIYPTDAQQRTLSNWMRTCCTIYNRALEQRIKAYRRRKQSVNYNQQQTLLTQQRSRMDRVHEVPVEFSRDALRRIDRGMKAFFRRVRAGENPGFPRFRSWRHYNSMEYAAVGQYVRGDCLLMIPKLGLIKFRACKQAISKTQRLMRVICRASGWYVQVLVDEVKPEPILNDCGPIGIDMGLNSFATMSDGRKIENPRWARASERKIRSLQRRVSRRVKGSNRRHKAIAALRRRHERIASQRRSFCHQHSTAFVRNHPLIAIENLNIKGLARTRMAKSIMDAGWNIFLNQISYKAANAGRILVRVDPRGTSQTCPTCGVIKKKELSERIHRCECGCTLDRDVAASRVILARAVDVNRGDSRVEAPVNTRPLVAAEQTEPLNRVDLTW